MNGLNNSSRLDFQPSEFENVTAFHSSRWHELLSAVWLCVVFVGGVLLNGFTLLVFFRNKKLITGSNIYIIALLFNNLTLCSLSTGMPVVAEFSGHWFRLMNIGACVTEAFIVYLFGLASLFVLVAIAISRYVAITGSSLTANGNKVHAISAVAVCEFLALVFAVAPLIGWGSYGLEAHGTSCGLEWRDRSGSAYSYLITITIACFVLPVVIIMYCYIRIYQSVRSSPRIRVAVATGQPSRDQKEKNLLRISIAFVLTFLLSWTPYALVSFYIVYGKPERLNPMLSRSAALIAKSQVLWNPIIYFLIAKHFRREAINTFPCKFKASVGTEMVSVIWNTQTARITRIDHTTQIIRSDSSKQEETFTTSGKGMKITDDEHISSKKLEHFRNRYKETPQTIATSENSHLSTFVTEYSKKTDLSNTEIKQSENTSSSNMEHTEIIHPSETTTEHAESSRCSEKVITHSDNFQTPRLVKVHSENISTTEIIKEQSGNIHSSQWVTGNFDDIHTSEKVMQRLGNTLKSEKEMVQSDNVSYHMPSNIIDNEQNIQDSGSNLEEFPEPKLPFSKCPNLSVEYCQVLTDANKLSPIDCS